MTKQFGRSYKVEVGKDEAGIAIETLRVDFNFEKSASSEPNKGTVKIYNLNPSNRQLILSKEYTNIRVSVGYNELKMIFLGEIVEAKLSRSGLDWVLDLEVYDGKTDYIKAYAAMTVAAGTTNNNIYKLLADTFWKAKMGDVEKSVDKPLPRAKVLFGNTRDLLTQVTRNVGADWSIQDDELVILGKDKVRNDEGFLISQNSGMIDAPESTDKGVKVKCLLNPELKIGGLVRIDSIYNNCNGDYKIVNLTYKGDSHSNTWMNEMTLVGGKFESVSQDKEGDKKEVSKADQNKKDEGSKS